MKRILLSLLILGSTGALAVGVSRAFFSDTEKSTGNTFTAGALDLKVDSECHYDNMQCNAQGLWENEPNKTSTYPELLGTACTCTWVSKDLETGNLFFNYGDVKPGDEGENTISLTAIDNDAHVCAYVQNLANAENSCNEPECLAEGGTWDGICTGMPTGHCGSPGATFGELQDNLFMTVWRDTNCNNVLEGAVAGHCVNVGATIGCDGPEIVNNQVLCELMQPSDCAWVPAQSAEEVLVPNTPIDSNNGVWSLGQLVGDQKTCLGVGWNVPNTVSNVIQTDSVTSDIAFYVEQVRNNPNFTCPATLPTEPTPGP